MRRTSSMLQLDVAVERSDVIVLNGLPRVGRTSFLDDWIEHRNDAIRCRLVEDVNLAEGIFVIDHVTAPSVDQIINVIRAAENTKSRTRLVLVPSDLVAAEKLRTALPGAVRMVEITPLRIEEITVEVGQQAPAGPIEAPAPAATPATAQAADPNRHWVRGGLPGSLLASNDYDSMAWRRVLLEALLARDYTEWGIERGFQLNDMFRWLANQNGGELDESGCKFAKRQELKSAVYVFELLGLVRRVPSFPAGSSESMSRKQKLFIRDTGLLHASLGIETYAQLRTSDAIGGSFESYATEALILATEGRGIAQFYREKGASGEDEIDLILEFPSQNGRLVAIEFKVGPDRRPQKGFVNGCKQLKITDRFVVHAGTTSDLSGQVDRLDMRTAVARVSEISRER